MRLAIVASIAVSIACGGCGGASPPPPVYDDLELEGAMRRRDPAARTEVSGEVTGTVTPEVRHVTWRQAIDVIAHLEGLTVSAQDGIVMVTRAPR